MKQYETNSFTISPQKYWTFLRFYGSIVGAMSLETSTVLAALGGGALIGASASLLLLAHGRIAGVSGVLGMLLRGGTPDRDWRLGFLVGLVASGVVAALAFPSAVTASPVALPLVAAAGLLVGFGTRLGNGCTSGHGVCGISRLSRRSLVATVTFMLAGALTVIVVRALGGWS